MIIKNVSLDIVCGITSKMPETGRPEVAFAGKSNVGKSSLINGLMNRIQCGQIFPDQRTDEPEIPCTYQRRTGKDTDDQLL